MTTFCAVFFAYAIFGMSRMGSGSVIPKPPHLLRVGLVEVASGWWNHVQRTSSQPWTSLYCRCNKQHRSTHPLNEATWYKPLLEKIEDEFRELCSSVFWIKKVINRGRKYSKADRSKIPSLIRKIQTKDSQMPVKKQRRPQSSRQ